MSISTKEDLQMWVDGVHEAEQRLARLRELIKLPENKIIEDDLRDKIELAVWRVDHHKATLADFIIENLDAYLTVDVPCKTN